MHTKPLVAALVLFTVAAAAYTTGQAQSGNTLISSFVVRDVKFDAGLYPGKPAPTFPKTWKLISVANGEKMNSNTLWFQGADSNVYMLSGFTDAGQFVLRDTVQRITAR